MFAIIKTGGKQYRVSPGDTIFVEKLLGNSGDTVTLSEVLMVNHDNKIDLGIPFVNGAAVQATIREQARGDKIIVFKKKRRQGYRRKKGHRQDITVLKIDSINMNGLSSVQTASMSNTADKIHTQEAQTSIDTMILNADIQSTNLVADVLPTSTLKKVSAKKSVDSTVAKPMTAIDIQDEVEPKVKMRKPIASTGDESAQAVVKKTKAKAQQESKD